MLLSHNSTLGSSSGIEKKKYKDCAKKDFEPVKRTDYGDEICGNKNVLKVLTVPDEIWE